MTTVDLTKTKARLRIPLPEDLMKILRWHKDRLPDGRGDARNELSYFRRHRP